MLEQATKISAGILIAIIYKPIDHFGEIKIFSMLVFQSITSVCLPISLGLFLISLIRILSFSEYLTYIVIPMYLIFLLLL